MSENRDNNFFAISALHAKQMP